MTNTATRVATYRRVSTNEQATSLTAQQTALNATVEARGWTLVAEFVDEGRTGSNMNRPALHDALDFVKAGNADVLLVHKLDRLARSVGDFVAMTETARRNGFRIVCLDADVDTTTPVGEMVATVLASFAQMERRLIAQRTSEALQAKKAAGQRLGQPVQLPESVRQTIVARRADGWTLQRIADALTAENVPTARGGRWYPGTVRHVLKSVELDEQAKAARAA